jgi:hypothetical protein
MEPAIEPRTKSHLAEPVYFAGSTLGFLAQSSQQTTSSLPPTFTLMPASVGRHAAAEVLAKRARAPQRDAVFVGILFGLGAAGAGPADVIAHAHQRTLVEHAEFQRQLGGRRHQSIVSFLALRNQNRKLPLGPRQNAADPRDGGALARESPKFSIG